MSKVSRDMFFRFFTLILFMVLFEIGKRFMGFEGIVGMFLAIIITNILIDGGKK